MAVAKGITRMNAKDEVTYKVPPFAGMPDVYAHSIDLHHDRDLGTDRAALAVVIHGDAKTLFKMANDMRMSIGWWKHAAHMDEVSCAHCTMDAMAEKKTITFGHDTSAQATP